jgi:hypothetical protein
VPRGVAQSTLVQGLKLVESHGLPVVDHSDVLGQGDRYVADISRLPRRSRSSRKGTLTRTQKPSC